jgi:hypothetical protein
MNWVSRIEEQRKVIKNNEEKNQKLLFVHLHVYADSYFLLKLKGYFLYFTPIVHFMLKLRIHFRLVLIVYIKCIDSSPYTHVAL